MRAFLILAFTLLSGSAYAGVYIGNGGNVINCTAASNGSNNLNGYYALDYLLTLDTSTGSDDMTPVTSWQESADHIYNLLINKVPALAPSFKDFTNLVYNTSYAQMRVWEPSPFGLVQLNDQRITSLIPTNCQASDGTYQIVQAVIREYSGFSGTQSGHYIYKYVPQLLQQLDQQSPLQLSYLLVHEWLWDLSSNVDRNRRINHFLHSRDIETMSAVDVVANLTGMGLTIPGSQANSFDPLSCQGYPLTEQELFAKYTGSYVMQNLGQLTIDRRERVADCAENELGCNPQWVPPVVHSDLFTSNRFFLSPTWAADKTYPLKVLSPDLMQTTGTPLVPGAGQIQCKYVSGTATNLECEVLDSSIADQLFGGIDGSPMQNPPTILALVTEECFRMDVVGHYSMDVVNPQGQTSSKDILTETVFSTRFNWTP
jgi:hypothetical protein